MTVVKTHVTVGVLDDGIDSVGPICRVGAAIQRDSRSKAACAVEARRIDEGCAADTKDSRAIDGPF